MSRTCSRSRLDSDKHTHKHKGAHKHHRLDSSGFLCSELSPYHYLQAQSCEMERGRQRETQRQERERKIERAERKKVCPSAQLLFEAQLLRTCGWTVYLCFIKDSFEGEMLMIDNLSGSVFHHYSSPPVCKDCRTHPQEQIHMAELEQASLRSEQLSDKSSSPALPDDLSLDEQSVYQMAAKEGKERGCDEYLNTEDPGGRGHSRLRRPSRVHSSGAEDGAAVNGAGSHHNTPARHSIALPAPPRGRPGHKPRGLRLTSPASWASLRSPGANTRLLTTQYPSHSDSSLATGSSESSLPATMEEGLSFIVSTTQPLLDTLLDDRASLSTETLRPSPPAGQSLQTTRGHQRSKSSCERDINAGRTRQGSDEDVGMVRCGSNQTCDSQQLSETQSSLSLTSLLPPSSLAPPSVKKCNSMGSLDQGTLTTLTKEPQGKITSPWKEGRRESQSEAAQGKNEERSSLTCGIPSQSLSLSISLFSFVTCYHFVLLVPDTQDDEQAMGFKRFFKNPGASALFWSSDGMSDEENTRR
ncbi:Voltage-dependent T-type calcium channel subunit alpha-1I [Labeo rohita]|uniref:Voltage-dependent T-type calcium channel subunit alpha-1I n=1 Tax=Labeo rohita TaxID=84645 RepID=A0ABQ8MUQ9_LABRO|nr:Voltage-dependent T-type calcium channel subunit alpha-1I [Labeo rohita]